MSKFTDEWGFFTQMPESIIKRTAELGSDAVFLFMYFRYRTNSKRGCAFPTYKTMCEDIGWGRRRIKVAIDKLEEFEYLKRHKRYGESTEYFLTRPPDVGGTVEETASSSITEILQESRYGTISSRATEPSVFPPTARDLDSVNYTESIQTELKDSDDTKRRPRDLLFDAIAEVCCVDPKTAGSSIAKVRHKLGDASYSPEDVYQFKKLWWKDSWRQKPPTLWKLQEQIGIVKNAEKLPTDGYREVSA